MLTIILGILIAFLIIVIGARITNNNSDIITLSTTLCTLIIVVSIAVGLFLPLSGYTNWEPLSRKDLISLSNSTVGGSEGFIYVSVSSSNIYTYRYQVNSEFGTDTSKDFVTETVDGECVIEVEDESIDTAYLQIYTRKAQKSIWTFGFFVEQYKYVFYVPPGSISKDVNLS